MDRQEELEAGFRESCRDFALILEALVPFCGGLDELAGMLRLADKNDGQLRLLMNLAKAQAEVVQQQQATRRAK